MGLSKYRTAKRGGQNQERPLEFPHLNLDYLDAARCECRAKLFRFFWGDLPIVSIVVPFFGLTKSILRILKSNPKKELQWRLEVGLKDIGFRVHASVVCGSIIPVSASRVCRVLTVVLGLSSFKGSIRRGLLQELSRVFAGVPATPDSWPGVGFRSIGPRRYVYMMQVVSVCVCICIYIYVHTYIYICMYVYTYVPIDR